MKIHKGGTSHMREDGDMRSVLIVDDTASMRLIARLMLETEPGWVIVGEVNDGQEAVDLVRQTQPDVIVLDYQMPVLDGLQALPLLRAQCPAARIVLWSSESSIAAAAMEAGADAFVPKTASMDELVDALTPAVPRLAEQRRVNRAVPVRKPEHLVLTLPAHRIVPGAVVAWTTADGHPRRIVLPPDVTAGAVLPLESVGVDGTPRHLLLLSA